MILLLLSWPVHSNTGLAYALLLLSTTGLGLGFGLTVPTLNTMTAAFHPGAVDKAVLSLNALLGLGTALAPVFVAVFDGLGFWWGLPLLSAVLLALLLVACVRQDLTVQTPAAPQRAPGAAKPGIPAKFWLFAAFAVLTASARR